MDAAARIRQVFDDSTTVAEGWTTDQATATAMIIVTAYEGSVTLARALHSTDPITNAAAMIAELIARSAN